MASSIRFLLVNRIENTTIVDRIADHCLAPARGLIQLYGRSVKVYHVYLSDQTIYDETPPVLPIKSTLLKVIKYIFYFVFVIPATPIGLGLKKIALCSATLYKKMTVLFHQLNGSSQLAISKEETLKALIFPASESRRAIVDAVTLNIFQFIVPNSLALMRRTCRSFRDGINKHQAFLVSRFRNHYHGIPKAITPGSLTFRALNRDFLIQEGRFNYMGKLYEIFGGRENLMSYPILEREIPVRPEMIFNEIALSSPLSIIRVRNVSPHHFPKEYIIVKFSACLPLDLFQKEKSSGGPSKDKILIWHDYLILEQYGERWTTSFDDMLRGGRERVQFIDTHGIRQSILRKRGDDTLEKSCPSLEFFTLPDGFTESFDRTTLNLRNLIIKGSGVFFNTDPRYADKIPAYIRGSTRSLLACDELHDNFPIVLGHVTDPKLFKRATLFFPDYIEDKHGNKVRNPNLPTGGYNFVTKWMVASDLLCLKK